MGEKRWERGKKGKKDERGEDANDWDGKKGKKRTHEKKEMMEEKKAGAVLLGNRMRGEKRERKSLWCKS